MEHKCELMKQSSVGGYGTAIDEISKDGNGWGLGNGEYWTYPIRNCPFCGVLLESLDE